METGIKNNNPNTGEEIAQFLESDEFKNWSQAEENLRAGISATYRDEKYPGKLIREYPGGHREFIDLDTDGNEIVVGVPD